MDKGYIAVDLDGTLAFYDEFKGVGIIGDPIPVMFDRVCRWLAEGRDVRIFTARVAGEDADIEREAIRQWCLKVFGCELPVTCYKDYEMKEMWDDLAVRVIKNTGLVSDGSDVEEPSVELGDIGAVM